MCALRCSLLTDLFLYTSVSSQKQERLSKPETEMEPEEEVDNIDWEYEWLKHIKLWQPTTDLSRCADCTPEGSNGACTNAPVSPAGGRTLHLHLRPRYSNPDALIKLAALSITRATFDICLVQFSLTNLICRFESICRCLLAKVGHRPFWFANLFDDGI